MQKTAGALYIAPAVFLSIRKSSLQIAALFPEDNPVLETAEKISVAAGFLHHIHQLHHSATQLQATGAYSGSDKTVLLCIVNSSQVNELTKLVAQFPDSFVIVSSVSSVVGNFKRLDSHGKPQTTFYDGGIPKQGN